LLLWQLLLFLLLLLLLLWLLLLEWGVCIFFDKVVRAEFKIEGTPRCEVNFDLGAARSHHDIHVCHVS
jgi:hypothetical protein